MEYLLSVNDDGVCRCYGCDDGVCRCYGCFLLLMVIGEVVSL
jgi:hypothetical protein